MQSYRGRSDFYSIIASESHSAGSSPQFVADGTTVPAARTLRIDPDIAHSSTTPSSPLTAPAVYSATEYFETQPGTIPTQPTVRIQQHSPSQLVRLTEPPSHTLFVRNLINSVEEKDIRMLFSPFGEISNIFMGRVKTRGYVMVTFYDIRNSMEAARSLQGAVLHGKHMDIHYGIPKDNPSEEEQNNGTLFVRNLDASVTDEDIISKFQKYGQIREVRNTPGKRGHRFVEFYDTRDAKNAMDHENNTLLHGNIITIELSRPGGQYQRFLRHGFPPQAQPQIQPPLAQSQMFEDQTYISQYPASAAAAPTPTTATVATAMASSGGASPGTSLPPPPLPLERRMAALTINSAYASSRIMPLFVPASSQLEPEVPKQNLLFDRSRHLHKTRLTVEPYKDVNSSPLTACSATSTQTILPSTPSVDIRAAQRPFLKRESASSQALTRQIPGSGPVCPPSMYTPPMHYSPILFTSASEGSGSSSGNTATPCSTVEPNAMMPMGLNYPGTMPFFQPVVTSSGSSGATGTQTMSRHRPSLSTPSQSELVEHSALLDQYKMRGASPQFALPTTPTIPRQMSPSSHSSGSSSPSPTMHASAMARGLTPTPIVSGETIDIVSVPPQIPSSSVDHSYDVVLKDREVSDSRTTLYIKNIPHRINPTTFLSMMMNICPNGFLFLYLPNSKQNSRSNNGYAFVKLISTAFVPCVVNALNNRPWPRYSTDKICEVKYATVQSFQGLLKQFDTTTLLTDSERWPPIILYHGEYTQLTPEIFAILRNPTN